jgi:hypothetical protein
VNQVQKNSSIIEKVVAGRGLHSFTFQLNLRRV